MIVEHREKVIGGHIETRATHGGIRYVFVPNEGEPRPITSWERRSLLLQAGQSAVEDITPLDNCLRYDARVNELELVPNLDDYNALIEMLSGAPYREPSLENR